ncbi:methyltransferase TRM13-domain-containing protein [Zopfochytrium polystomum]|nr:methyltransferase TRM13-domain-containing protein [Zopfochytrium polystomum]
MRHRRNTDRSGSGANDGDARVATTAANAVDDTTRAAASAQDPSSSSPPPPPPTTPRRYCPLKYRADSLIPFCYQHALVHKDAEPQPFTLPTSSKRRRTFRSPCPYDPLRCEGSTHPNRHLTTCNFRPVDAPHVQMGVNSRGAGYVSSDHVQPSVRLPDAPIETVLELIQKIRNIWTKLCGSSSPDDAWELRQLCHPSMESRILFRPKHTRQLSSLLSHLEDHRLLNKSKLYVEFGCGAAEFSDSIHRALGDPSRFILIDRASTRWRAKERDAPQGTYHKVKVDIADLVLGGLDAMKKNVPEESAATAIAPLDGVVGISKHLCGSATDLTLRCLEKYSHLPDSTANLPLDGLLIALCCHHRCDLSSYIYPSFLLEDCGMSSLEVSLLFSMSSWAVCGRRSKTALAEKEDADSENGNEEEHDDHQDVREADVSVHASGLSYEERRSIGVMCKGIINVGRREFLRSQGFEAELFRYIDRGFSPENVALAAWRGRLRIF